MTPADTSADMALDTGPYNPTRRHLFLKTLLGLVVGIFISFLVFIFLILVGGILQEALASRFTGNGAVNPLLPMILIIIAFLWTFIGSTLLAWIYNLIYTDKYYDMSKMFSLVLFSNAILFFVFLGLYGLFAGNVTQLFFVLALHIFFTVFLSYSLMEISTNPNYSAVHLLGAALGLTIAIIIFAIAYKVIDMNEGSSINILLALPPVLAYLSLPFRHTLREKIYYRFYSMGYNFFYIPSLSEVLVDEEEVDDVEVDTGA